MQNIHKMIILIGIRFFLNRKNPQNNGSIQTPDNKVIFTSQYYNLITHINCNKTKVYCSLTLFFHVVFPVLKKVVIRSDKYGSCLWYFEMIPIERYIFPL